MPFHIDEDTALPFKVPSPITPKQSYRATVDFLACVVYAHDVQADGLSLRMLLELLVCRFKLPVRLIDS